MSSFTVNDESSIQKVRIIYNMYNDIFPLVNGTLSASEIDEEYCLSDIMPGCSIQLSRTTPAEYTKLAQKNPQYEIKYEKEEPKGTFINLLSKYDYYVWIKQDEENLTKDQSNLENQCIKLEERIIENNKINFIQPNNQIENRNDALLNDDVQGYDQQYNEFNYLKDTWGGDVEEEEGGEEINLPSLETEGKMTDETTNA
jgi:hypothetical protein